MTYKLNCMQAVKSIEKTINFSILVISSGDEKAEPVRLDVQVDFRTERHDL